MKTTPIPAEALAFPADSGAVTLWARFRRFATYMAARYNGPVYLVGSALRKSTYRDVDIRVEIADDEFCARYGYKHYSEFVYPNQAWIDDMAKYNGEIALGFRLTPDFQVYPVSHCIQYRMNPRLLLAAPTNLEHLARSTAWWDEPPSPSAPAVVDSASGFSGEDAG